MSSSHCLLSPRHMGSCIREQPRTADDLNQFLSQIPTDIGKLAFLASCRDLTTGRYCWTEGHKCAYHLDRILRVGHADVFSATLTTCSARKMEEDLRSFLSDLNHRVSVVATLWLELEIYKLLIPLASRTTARKMFCDAIQMALERLIRPSHGPMMMHEHVVLPDNATCRFSEGIIGADVENWQKCFRGLSTRRRAVLELIGQGKTSKEIASILSISPATVSEHRKQLCRRLNAHSTTELIMRALQANGNDNARTVLPEAG